MATKDIGNMEFYKAAECMFQSRATHNNISDDKNNSDRTTDNMRDGADNSLDGGSTTARHRLQNTKLIRQGAIRIPQNVECQS